MTAIDKAMIGRLRSIASSRAEISMGGVKLLGLNEVRDYFGAEWEVLKPRVMRHVELALEKTLAPCDVSVAIGEEGYVIVFADPDGEHAEERLRAISHEIHRRLFGEDARLAARIGTRASRLARDETTGALIEGPPLTESLSAPKTLRPKARPACGKNLEPALPPVLFHPIWSVDKGVVIEFAAKPVLIDKGLRRWRLGAADTAEARKSGLRLDLATIAKVRQEFERLRSSEVKSLISLCLSASSFSRASYRAEIMAAIGEIPGECRQLLKCIVYETRNGAVASDVESACKWLTPLCRSVRISTVLDDAHLLRIKAIGVQSVGIDLTPYADIPEEILMGKVERFATGARALGLNVVVDGVVSRSLSSFAVCCDADHVGGDIIGSAVDRIPAAIRYEPSHLYDNLR